MSSVPASFLTRETDARIPMIEAMIGSVPDGHYAVQPDSLTPMTFIRVSRPTYGRYKGWTKLQTQHSETYMTAAMLSPSDYLLVYGGSNFIESLMQVMADNVTAARNYAHEIGRCCRCNKELTDERSRHYGIGPVCDKVRPDIIEAVDLEFDGRSYETLRLLGLCA